MAINDLTVEKIGQHLDGKNIALCVSGGIASIEAVKLARHLRRFGANVKPYATQEGLKFITKDALEWATGNKLADELSGMAEHVAKEDLVLIAPATLNTINKIFQGIADNAVTTLVSSALGSKKPVLIAPTMHESMFKNPFLQQNLEKAEEFGIKVISPRLSEEKAKIPHISTMVAETIRAINLRQQNPINHKKILVTSGSTPVEIDSVRTINNTARGTIGIKIATEAFYRGADVKLLITDNGINVPDFLEVERFKNFAEYFEKVMRNLNQSFDAGIFAAAVADFKPREKFNGKIPSCTEFNNITLQKTPKIIEIVRNEFPELIMATFKLESNISKEDLLEIAKNRIESGFDIVVANRMEDLENSTQRGWILNKFAGQQERQVENSDELAMELVSVIIQQMEGKL